MIGLGSNRLTCCRRGGMAITQAGRGGMEWLAGGRMPSWATPYSAQATAALKDAFTAAQWVTIRDYGFAHPSLVPFINEDPMLVMSLIDGLGTRMLQSDGNCWIDTGIKPYSGIIIQAIFASMSNDWTGFGARIAWQNKMCGAQVNVGTGSLVVDTGNDRVTVSDAYQQGREISVEINDSTHKAKVNGTQYNISSVQPNDYNIFVFMTNNAGSPTNGASARYKSFIIQGQRQLVPFFGATRTGMLDIRDLEHPEYLPKQGTGSFTISETPAS